MTLCGLKSKAHLKSVSWSWSGPTSSEKITISFFGKAFFLLGGNMGSRKMISGVLNLLELGREARGSDLRDSWCFTASEKEKRKLS